LNLGREPDELDEEDMLDPRGRKQRLDDQLRMEDTVTPGIGLRKRHIQGSKRSKSQKKMERLSDDGLDLPPKKKKAKEQAPATGYFSGLFSMFGSGKAPKDQSASPGFRQDRRNLRSKSAHPYKKKKRH
jgi:hypothetical protein